MDIFQCNGMEHIIMSKNTVLSCPVCATILINKLDEQSKNITQKLIDADRCLNLKCKHERKYHKDGKCHGQNVIGKQCECTKLKEVYRN